MTDFSRRSLLKSAVAGAVGAMTFPAVASAAETKFDKEADVIVLGFGGAGAATAITAADNGASVIIIERQPQATLRSNTRMSGGIFHCPEKIFPVNSKGNSQRFQTGLHRLGLTIRRIFSTG